MVSRHPLAAPGIFFNPPPKCIVNHFYAFNPCVSPLFDCVEIVLLFDITQIGLIFCLVSPFVLALEGGVNSNPSSREMLFLRTAYIPFCSRLALEGGVNSNPSSKERLFLRTASPRQDQNSSDRKMFFYCFFLFLAPYARTTLNEEAFLPKGKKRPRSHRSLGLAISRVFPDFVLFDGFISLWNSLFTRKKNARE